jgi:ferric-dicitrate binding protein FerR (iron transport regulator)
MKAPEFNADETLMAIDNRRTLQEIRVVQLNPFKKFMKVAAVAAFLVIGSYFYLNTLDEKITTQFAESKEVVLPDNSEVILNADSQLTYSEKKWDEQRNVDLSGEAFFKVAKGKRFTVATDAGTVAVLGTQFNVENRKGFFEVTCFEGLVGVTFKGREIKLSAGSSFLAINGEIRDKIKSNGKAPSWLNAESTFKSIPLKYVLQEFERQHNILVETQNIDMNQLYTGSFSNTDTDVALKSISMPSQIKFKLEGDKVLFYAEKAE